MASQSQRHPNETSDAGARCRRKGNVAVKALAITALLQHSGKYCYCGCSGGAAGGAVSSGAGVGGGVAVLSVGGEAGSKYHTKKSATTTAAAMMSNLVRSIRRSLCLQVSLALQAI